MIDLIKTANKKPDEESKFVKKNTNNFLIISYFDRLIGPSIFYCKENLDNVQNFDLSSVLDVLDSGTFIFARPNFRTINYVFNIESIIARGGVETVMISYMIKNMDFDNVFKYLESKVNTLENFANELKELEDFSEILHKKDKSDNILSLCSEKFKKCFLEIYDKYDKKISISFKNELRRKIEVSCPVCNKSKEIQIPERIIEFNDNKTRIFIPKFRVCNHDFMLLVNRNFRVQSYHKVDFNASIEISNEKKAQDIDVFSIRIKIKPELLTYLINAILFNKKVLLLVNNELDFKDEIIEFIDFLFRDTFNLSLLVKNYKYFKKNKTNSKNYVVLKHNSRNLNNKKLSNETNCVKEIIYQFYNNSDSISAIIKLRDKIREIYILSQKLYNFYENKGIHKILSRKRIVRYLENEFFVKIKKDYFNLLANIVNHYYKINITWLHDYIAEKIENMWSKSSTLID